MKSVNSEKSENSENSMKSIRKCKCGKPVKVVRGFQYQYCESCWQLKGLTEKLVQELDKIKIRRNIRHEKTERLRKKIAQVLPVHYHKAHLRDIAVNLRHLMLNLPLGKGLYLYGQAGRGKTYSMAALMRKFTLEGRKVRRAQWEMLLMELRSTFGQGGDRNSELAILRPHLECEILLLEDVGTTISSDVIETDFTLRILYEILDTRLENHRLIFITSNKSLEQIELTFDSKIASRIAACCVIQSIGGNDKRKSKDYERAAGKTELIIPADSGKILCC